MSQLALTALLLASTAAECPPAMPNGITNSNNNIVVDGGSDFSSATALTISDGETLSFVGTVGNNAPEVFNLGAVSPGDRFIIEVRAAQGSTLDPVIATFGDAGTLIGMNDDINFDLGDFDSALDEFVTVASPNFYLAIAKYFLDDRGGRYNATVRIERGGSAPARPPQTLLLNFAGGPAIIRSEGSFDLDPFDAADIDAAYSGKTASIKAKITETVVENFSAFNIAVVTTDENPSLTPGTFSTIHFGAFSSTKFGVADDVDFGNLDRCDDGIIFTNGFDNPFGARPSPDGIAIAIGNVAAHEAGHLLGLSHVADVLDLMDNTGTASTLLADQDFKTSVLSPSVFPIGDQDGPALLIRVLPD